MRSRITYNGKHFDFTVAPYRLQINPDRRVLRNISASGKQETLNVRSDLIVDIGFRNLQNRVAADATLKRYLLQWLMWAEAGMPWTLARDYTDMVLTTLTGNEAAGQTVIGLTSTTGIVADRQYVIRSEVQLEVVKVLSVDSSVQVTLTESLNHPYSTGDRFRTEQYWPGRLIENKNPISENPPLFYNFDLMFAEDVNLL